MVIGVFVVKKYFSTSLLFLFIIVALLYLVGYFTKAFELLKDFNWLIFSFAIVFFLLSIAVWLFAWAYLIKRSKKTSFSSLMLIGISCIYAALTPVQIGTEALRSIKLKQFFNMPYSDSISASMLAKGLKFAVLALVSAAVLVSFFSNFSTNFLVLIGFVSGFIVVMLASLLFLLPLNKKFGSSIASFFLNLGTRVFFLKKVGYSLHDFFKGYSNYLNKISLKAFFILIFLVILSWFFELLALQFTLLSIGVIISFESILLLLVIISVLERTPLLPRGIIIVELVGAAFLSSQTLVQAALSLSQIGAIILALDFVRLVIPTIVGLIFEPIVLALRHYNKL